MNGSFSRRNANLSLAVELLEHRVLLDAGLGNEIAQFASEEALKSALIERAVSQHESLFGQEVGGWGCGDFELCGPELVSFNRLEGGDAVLADDASFSDTNTQVGGVDEGDIVETDGDYVYILSDNLVSIVDVRDVAHPRVASRVKLDPDSYGSEMYLDGDRLMVLSTGWHYGPEPFPLPFRGGPVLIDDAIFVSDALFWSPGQSTVVATVIDVSDREDPSIVSRTEVDGSLSNSRAIDGTGYLVVNDYLAFPTLESQPVDTVNEDGKLVPTRHIYETEEAYRARIGSNILDVLPDYSTYDVNGTLVGNDRLAAFSDTYQTTNPNFGSLVSVVTIDMHSEIPTADEGTSVIMDSGHEIFMSVDSLYLFQTKWGQHNTTSIMKFDVNAEDGSVQPVASGTVHGRMLNQFSADEMNGNLRIATTTGFGRESSSGVYVLEQLEDDLSVKGSVEELAPGEQIFSARFVGDRAYVVTFRQVDPLFSIDLTDPSNPTVEGELKIPGFSEYLQPIDENHLLAIGRDADPVTGRSEALQLSLFDVSDITQPELVDRYTFDDETYAYSIAEHDHHAFGYYPEFDTLAIPVSSNGGGTWLREEEGLRFWVPAQYNEALQVFTVDVDAGFDFVGAIDHPSQVRRSLRVNDALYSVSHDTLKVNSITDPDDLLGQLHYLPPQNGGVVPTQPKAADIDLLFDQAQRADNDPGFDLDGNSLVNEDDVTFMVEAVLRTRSGDTNLDGDVDFQDFLTLSLNFEQEGGWTEGDFNGDGEITFDDFVILSTNFGR